MATLNGNWQLVAQSYLGNTNGTLNWYIRVYGKLISQNTANNSSVVAYESRIYGEGSGTYFYTGSTTLKSLQGTNASGSIENAEGTYYKGETTLQTFNNITVPHNSDGTKSVWIRGIFNSGPWGWDVAADGTADLPRIPRQFTQTPKVEFQSNTTTSGTFKWTTSENASQVNYILDGGSETQCFSGDAKTGTFSINNLNSNTSHTLKIKAKRKDSGLWSDGNTINFSTSNKTVRIRVNGQWKNATPYIRVSGQWKVATPYIRVSGQWKRGK